MVPRGDAGLRGVEARVKKGVLENLARLRREGVRRGTVAAWTAMGRPRRFAAYDRGPDTFVFELVPWKEFLSHASVLIAEKRDLKAGASGFVMTVTTGNHSVAALPLLQGRLWDLARVTPARRGDILRENILCANIVDGRFEVSQRDVPCARLVRLDAWLTQALSFRLGDVVMIERNSETLAHYRRTGCEWRVKPLAWTEREMSCELAASRKRISTSLRYYHSTRGIHFLSYAEFHRFAMLAGTDFPQFRASLHELTSVFEGQPMSYLRLMRLHGHHEIELFGLRRGVALECLVPELERLMERIVLCRITQAEVVARMEELDALYRTHLARPEYADENSSVFTEALYMSITGEIYSLLGEGSTPAFDDRRTALPGATFVDGRPQFHPGADTRNEVLLSNLRFLMSRDERVEYANVYELRTDEGEQVPLGEGLTREVVYKTSLRPLESSFVEKRLARMGAGYGGYVIARVEAMKALGVALPDYRLFRRRAQGNERSFNYYVRSRCEGVPLEDIAASLFRKPGREAGEEDGRVVSALAILMGDAAAQNMAMKKYDAATASCLYGVGKEIYRFGYDIKAGRQMPQHVSCCSARGIFGWQDVAQTDENFSALVLFYLTAYARAFAPYCARHGSVPVAELIDRFLEGFEVRSRAMEWQLTIQDDWFAAFRPAVAPRYRFPVRWEFVQWALRRQTREFPLIRRVFAEAVQQAFAAPSVV